MIFNYKKEQEKSLAEIAQMMSEKANYRISVKDVKTEIRTATLSIYSVVIRDNPRDILSSGRTISCTVRKWKTPYEYELTEKRIS